jgi:hypothetical protein
VPEETEIGEVGVDKVSEEAHEKAHAHGHRQPWIRWLALSTALFAVVAALASLQAGHYANEALLHGNEATLKQSQASDQWSYYQAKGIKSVVRDAEADLLAAAHPEEAGTAKVRDESKRYAKEQAEIQEKAKKLEEEREELEQASTQDLRRHQTFAYIVTTLQVAIGLSAVAALIERRSIWLFALLVGLAGVTAFLVNLARHGFA